MSLSRTIVFLLSVCSVVVTPQTTGLAVTHSFDERTVDMLAPFSLFLDTAGLRNLDHALTATARDLEANTTSRAPLTVRLSSTAAASGQPVSVLPTAETEPSHHDGDTADDSVIWVHPAQPALSLVIGDDKDGGLMVWDLSGRELQYVDGTNYNNVDLRYNFPLPGRFSDGTPHNRVDLLGVGNELGKKIDFFKVNPARRRLEPAGSIPTADRLIPYGSCMYHSPISGKYYYFVNAKSGVNQQYELLDAGKGQVVGTLVRQFDVGRTTEGCVADDALAQFYIAEEKVGIWKYGAEPGDGSLRTMVDRTATGGHLNTEVEGLTIYYAGPQAGYLIASSQGDSTLAVYQREEGNTFLGKFQVVANGAIDAVSGSDGIDVINLPLGPAFPQGLFVVHDSSNSGAKASNHKYLPWESIASALGLVIDTSWNPRQAGPIRRRQGSAE